MADPAWRSIEPGWLHERYSVDKAPVPEILAEAQAKDPRITRSVLRYALHQHGIVSRIEDSRQPDPAWLRKRYTRRSAAIRSRHLGGDSVKAIADDLGLTIDAVQQVLKVAAANSVANRERHSCARWKRRLKGADQVAEVERLYAEGRTVHVIGELLEVSCGSVLGHLNSPEAIARRFEQTYTDRH